MWRSGGAEVGQEVGCRSIAGVGSFCAQVPTNHLAQNSRPPSSSVLICRILNKSEGGGGVGI